MKYLKLSKEELETLYVALDNETKCFDNKLVCEDHKKDVYNILEQVIEKKHDRFYKDLEKYKDFI